MAADTQVSVDLAREFIARSRFYLNDEYRTKMRRAVEVIPPDAIWARPNDKSNSVGNLLVHLAGNVRQWIVSGVGGEADTRDRQAEFSARSGPPAEELLERLEDVLTEADAVLAGLSAETLSEADRARQLAASRVEWTVDFAKVSKRVLWMARDLDDTIEAEDVLLVEEGAARHRRITVRGYEIDGLRCYTGSDSPARET